MGSDPCGSSMLLALPDDVFTLVFRSLSPRDLCSLGLCCRSLYAAVASDKVWFTQCEMAGVVSHGDLIEWRKAISSYRALCRFLISVKPLPGIWVHQNPELGNVVYVMPGFVSVVGCRIIPQELGPLGIEDGPILWAPVFEIISDFDGSPTFFLHGREEENDYFYPGSLKPIEKNCNVLLLEVEPRELISGSKLAYAKSFIDHSDKEQRQVCRSDSGLSRSQGLPERTESMIPFGRLAFGDRRRLLEIVTSQVRFKVPYSARSLLFPHSRNDEEKFREDIMLLFERQSLLMQIYKQGGRDIVLKDACELPLDPTEVEVGENGDNLDSSAFRALIFGDDDWKQASKRKTIGRYFRNSFKQILGKSSSKNSSRPISKSGSSSSGSKHLPLDEFLKASNTIGLTLHASNMKLSSYRAWPNMHDSRFALYKLPMRVPTAGQEYAGLWGGTFGWPPGRPSEDKPGKALFFLLLSYEETEEHQLLIATKILEGTHYVLHPNGSAMFVVDINLPSSDPFPWDTDADSLPVAIKHAFAGDGIAHGYGFRYPGSKPGSLYVIQGGLLAFMWKETRAVLTLQRLNLQELLKKGERVPALPPIANFSYLTKSYTNVFAGCSNTTNFLTSPRFVF